MMKPVRPSKKQKRKMNEAAFMVLFHDILAYAVRDNAIKPVLCPDGNICGYDIAGALAICKKGSVGTGCCERGDEKTSQKLKGKPLAAKMFFLANEAYFSERYSNAPAEPLAEESMWRRFEKTKIFRFGRMYKNLMK
ncbi:MAG: hypothetical protein FWD15_01445 [Alphaproteobacteria bacterium]|nr:hypothetical protein [Alphaproteobacteria bacterium]